LPELVLSVIQPAFDRAAQVQLSPLAFTEIDPLPPEKATDCDDGLMLKEQPRCVTFSTCPAIDALPERSPPEFGAMPRVTNPPPPASLRTEAIVSQSDDEEAVHEQALPVASVTVTLTLPPPTAAV
jgi:hypothetical protein